MEQLIPIVLVLICWVVIAPIFGVIAFSRLSHLSRVEAELKQLKAQMRSGSSGLEPGVPTPLASAGAAPSIAAAERPVPRPAPAPSPPIAAAAKRERPLRSGGSIERWLAGNWLVWAGGLALGLGGLFLARVAIDAGLFGPMARTLAAALFGAVLCGAAFRAAGMKLVVSAEGALRYLPQLLCAAGLVSLYGAVLAAGALYGLVPPLPALVLFSAVSLLGLGLALRFGPVLGGLALAGGYCAPLLTGAQGGSVFFILPYAAAITALGLAIVHYRNWRFVSWIILLGTAFWGLAALAGGLAHWQSGAVGLYALACAVLAIVSGARFASLPLLPPSRVSGLVWLLRQRGESVALAYGFLILCGALIYLSGDVWPPHRMIAASLAAFCGLGLAAACWKPSYGAMAPVAAAGGLAALALWPLEVPGAQAGFATLGIGFAVVGTLGQYRQAVRGWLASAAALTPPAALALAFWRGGLEPGLAWGLGALLMAALAGALLDRMKRAGDFEIHPGASAAYATGLAASAGLAPFLVLQDLWLAPAFAVLAAIQAGVHRRFALWPLRAGAALCGAVTVVLLLRPGLLAGPEIVGLPVLNTLTGAVLLSVIALGAAAYLLAPVPRSASALMGTAFLAGFAGLGLVIRHAAGADSLYGADLLLVEAGALALSYTGMAASLSLRNGASGRPPGWVFGGAELVASLVGLWAIVMALAILSGATASGWPVFNLLTLAFAMPSVFIALQASGHRRLGHDGLASGLSIFAILLGGLWLSLEVRRGFEGADFTGHAIGQGEMWAHSAVWLVYALILLAWGVWRARPVVRFVSLAILLAAIVKVFLFDLGALDGVMRALSFMGLGAALLVAALFYQRFVFTLPSRRAAGTL